MYIKKIDHKDIIKIRKEEDSQRQHISVLSASPSNGCGNFLEDSISMIERTSIKLYPIVKEVLKRMIEEKVVGNTENQKQFQNETLYEKILICDDADMRSVLGFLNQNEWIFNLNIGNIMQIQPVNMKELLTTIRNETELSRDSFLEKISLLTVSYFCVSTEMRFILLSREQYLSTPVKRQRELESEFWHAKALEIACSFLPSECPLLNHVLLSYQKHHDPSMQPIKEDQEQNDILNVLRPLNGIESNKYQPIIRYLQNIRVMISPCPLSPLTKKVYSQTDKKVTNPYQNTENQLLSEESPNPSQTNINNKEESKEDLECKQYIDLLKNVMKRKNSSDE